MLKEHVKKKHYPRYLYKYRKLGEHTKDIIIYNRMYFGSPLDFNDPFDFNLPINLGESLKKNKKDLRFYLDKLKEKEILSPEKIKLQEECISRDTSIIEEAIISFIKDTGVCCFSKKCNDILMWSHYAENHRGICLKFDILKALDFFAPLLDVDYEKKVDLKIANFFRDSSKFIIKTIRTKFKCWEYENEFRSIKDKSIGFNYNNRFVEFEPSSLREIIFGFKTDDNIILEYKELCKILKRDIVFSKMKSCEDGTFKLKKVRC